MTTYWHGFTEDEITRKFVARLLESHPEGLSEDAICAAWDEFHSQITGAVLAESLLENRLTVSWSGAELRWSTKA
jgi:hypothetical protein